MATIWLDIESGTYYANPPLRIRANDWLAKDWECWTETMSDLDRQAWGEYHLQYGQTKQVSPSEWCDPENDIAGWPYT